jgi:hypothetical protein
VHVTGKHIDKAKGRVKEAAGTLTGNRRLKNKGRADQAKGSAKNPWTRSPAPSPLAREQTVEVLIREPTHPSALAGA